MKHKLTLTLTTAIGLFSMTSLEAAEVISLSEDCETALALSAGPSNLQTGAGVYLLGPKGYELKRESENGFYCIVERSEYDSVIPQCFDQASRTGNLKVVLDEAEMLRAGADFSELRDFRQKALADGKYPPSGPGLVYMISDYNYIFNGRDYIKAAPHVMYHAPFLTNADIGSDPRVALANTGLPLINAEGPHGFMISFVGKSSPTGAVESACQGQLPDGDKWQPFPSTD